MSSEQNTAAEYEFRNPASKPNRGKVLNVVSSIKYYGKCSDKREERARTNNGRVEFRGKWSKDTLQEGNSLVHCHVTSFFRLPAKLESLFNPDAIPFFLVAD